MPRQDSNRSPREPSCGQADDGRLEQMSVQNVDSMVAQEHDKPGHPERILTALPALAAETFNPLRSHILSQPWRHGIQSPEIHPVPIPIVPFRELWKIAASITVLSKM